MESSVVYSSCGSNRVPTCVMWASNDNLLIYGAANAIAVYDVEAYGSAGTVSKVLVAHTGRVNSVRWARKTTKDGLHPLSEFFVSASSDKRVIVWKKCKHSVYTPLSSLEGHSDIANVADLMVVGDPDLPQLCVASSGSDGKVFSWRISMEGEVTSKLELKQKQMALDVRFIPLHKESQPLLALGCDDFKIHFFKIESSFVELFQLAGHEDWIRCLDVTFDGSGNTIVASSSQDTLIRVWKISEKSEIKVESSKLRVTENIFEVNHKKFIASSESVLAGHDNWVYGVCWRSSSCGKLQLLSASMDKTMIIWEEDESGVWMDSVRVGEVGGNTLGFYGCAFSADGETILAHGFQGAFHIWKLNEQTNQWLPRHSFGGHFGEVTDLDWDPEGAYVLSCSTDQTTRLHGPWIRNGESPVDAPWFELARPQVHGHDLSCLTVAERYRFISGAEEKVARVFQAPEDFLQNFERLCSIKEDPEKLKNAPRGASVPALGLSNKPVYDAELAQEKVKPKSQSDMYQESSFSPGYYEDPPTEENLLQNTLWPETQKLYGHGFELFSLASNKAGTVLASACKASKAEHAGIILWDQKTWKQIATLYGHSLTVTQLCFSFDDKYLLSVSRDRTWALFKRASPSGLEYIPCARPTKESTHTRIIWSGDWSRDSSYFATASRDKTVIVWTRQVNSEEETWGRASSPLEVEEPVTAVAFAPVRLESGEYLIAVGLENGVIFIYGWQPTETCSWKVYLKLDQGNAHHNCVKRLRFCPVVRESKDGRRVLQLASGGSDSFLRIQNIFL